MFGLFKFKNNLWWYSQIGTFLESSVVTQLIKINWNFQSAEFIFMFKWHSESTNHSTMKYICNKDSITLIKKVCGMLMTWPVLNCVIHLENWITNNFNFSIIPFCYFCINRVSNQIKWLLLIHFLWILPRGSVKILTVRYLNVTFSKSKREKQLEPHCSQNSCIHL